MSIDQHETWFRAKKYGWGWSWPSTWQGWLVSAGYVFLVTVGAATLPREHPAVFTFYVLFLTAALLAVCWRKGEQPRWRWDGK